MQANVLLLSQRRISNLVAFCLAYEFEDTFSSVTDARLVESVDFPAIEFSRRAYKLARMGLGAPALARRVAPYPRSRITLEQDFELFFPVFSHLYELYSLATVPNWRRRCRKAACFITEVGSEIMPEYLVELLLDFDHIYLGSRNGVEAIRRITGRPCDYLPLAVDVVRFAPASIDQPRPIEICNIGRRSPITHQALLERADRDQSFYFYDTVAASGTNLKERTFRVDSPREHRGMLASILKRTQYYVANRSHVNKPEYAAAQNEISARFYEGAAAGTVMIGVPPTSEDFDRQFDWPDAVVHVPFDEPDIGRILNDLNAEPERLRAVRRNNVRWAACRHDWVHRIQTVFEALGLEPTDKMRARVALLEQIAERA